MKLPTETQWCRVEELSRELSPLGPTQIERRVAELEGAGEDRTVLTLLAAWHGLEPPIAPLGPGTIVGGDYRLGERLGVGGMGSVWRAVQRTIEREVALKILHPAILSPAARQRSLEEIRALGQLDHPGIVRIFDAGFHSHGEHGELPFFVMELIDGLPLDRWAAQPGVDLRARLEVVADIAEAVQAAHDRRIVHRDLKPANLLVRRDGRPVVLDFGIARFAGLVESEEVAVFSGTPQYAAPEQHLGKDQDFRSGESVDVYALGAVLFEVVAGRRLFEFPRGTSVAEMRQAVLGAVLPRLADVCPDCPAALEEIVTRALRRDPVERFYSVAALGRAIRRVAASLGEVVETVAPWAPAVGARVPGTQWELVEKIGEGGAGQVWVGCHAELQERLVFKFCATEEKARTLKREFTLYRLLKERIGQNPHFVRLHEVSLDEPPWYLMMDFEDACDLETWVARRPGGWDGVADAVRIEIAAQAAEALQAAHDAGILHRDIKPANLLIRETAGGGVHVLVADFGIGQIVLNELHLGERPLGFTRTVSGVRHTELSGTMMYLAPEVLEGQEATARADLYSLGVVLWQLLVGNLRAALDPSDWPSRVEDPLLRDDLRRCLAGAPPKRWSSTGELAARLRAIPERRREEARRRAELLARERSAYLRGVTRTAGIAVAVVLVLAALGGYAMNRSKAAAAALNDARAARVLKVVGELERLSVAAVANRHADAERWMEQVRGVSDQELAALADAYLKVLSLDDWSFTNFTTHSSSGTAPAEAVLDATGRFLLGRWGDRGVELREGPNELRAGPWPCRSADPVILAVAPEGRAVAMAQGREVRIWQSGRPSNEVRVLEVDAEVHALAWDHQGHRWALGLDFGDGTGGVEWRSGSAGELLARSGRTGAGPVVRVPEGMAFSPDDRRLAQWGTNSLHLVVWKREGDALVAVAQAYHPQRVLAAHWAAPNQIFTSAGDGFIRRWDLAGEGADGFEFLDHPVARFPGFEPGAGAFRREWKTLAVHTEGRLVVGADADSGEGIGFDASSGRAVLRFPAGRRVFALREQPEGVSIHDWEGRLGEFHLRRSPFAWRLASSRIGRFEDFDVAADGSAFACSGMGGVSVFDRESREHWGSTNLARSRGVRFQDPQTLVCSSRFGDFTLAWTGQALGGETPANRPAFLPGEHQRPALLALSAEPRQTISARAGAILWSREGETNLVTLVCDADAPPEDLDLAPREGRLLWVDRQERVWAAEFGTRSSRLTPWSGRKVAFLDDHCFAVGGTNGVSLVDFQSLARRRDCENLELGSLRELRRVSSRGLAAAAFADGRLVLGVLRLTGAAHWQPLVQLSESSAVANTRLRFAAGGRWLGAINSAGELQIWDTQAILDGLARVGCLPDGAGADEFPVPRGRSSSL